MKKYKSYKDLLKDNPILDRLSNFEYYGKNKHGHVLLKCRCKCGNEVIRVFSSINGNKNISCGCLGKEISKQTGLNNRKYFINEEKLVDNEYTAYIAGLLAADGWVEKTKTIAIGLSSVDIDLLEEIKNYFEYTGNILKQYKSKKNEKWADANRLAICNEKMYAFFTQRGIIRSKAKNYIIPNQYVFNNHFWRGVLDGDGCIFSYHYPKLKVFGLSIIGTKSLIKAFEVYAKSITTFNASIREFKNSRGLFELRITGKRVIPLLEAIYENKEKSLFMKRKYIKYKDFIKEE